MTTAEAARIHERIDELVDAVGAVKGDTKAIVGACKPCQERINRLSSVVGGNGTDGLVSRVAMIEGSRKESSRLSALFSHAAAATVAAVLAGIIVGFFVK